MPHHLAHEQLLYGHVYDADPVHETMMMVPQDRDAPAHRATSEQESASSDSVSPTFFTVMR